MKTVPIIKVLANKMLIVVIFAAQVFTCACTPSDEKAASVSAPLEQIIENQAVNTPEMGETNQPLPATITPTIASKVDEGEISKNILPPIYFPTDEEQLKIDEAAKSSYRRLLSILPKDDNSAQAWWNENTLIDTFNCFRLNFAYLNDAEYMRTLSKDEIVNVKRYIYDHIMHGFLNLIRYNSTEEVADLVENNKKIALVSYKNSQMFEILDTDNFKGLETLKALEQAAYEVAESANGEWETFKGKVIYLHELIEAIFINMPAGSNNGNITTFDEMHPSIKLVAIIEAKKGLIYADIRESSEREVIKTNYTTDALFEELADGLEQPQERYYKKIELEMYSLMDEVIDITLNKD